MKVLAVDDSAAYRRVLAQAVSRLGHECVLAEDGERAWELFRADRFDVVISNWMMPGLEGDELCRRIRGSDRPYAYFILFTALEGSKRIMDGMRAGADDYLEKPLDEDELEACLIAAERLTALHRRLSEQQGELQRLNRELYEQSRQDPLTGLGNRLRMQEDLERVEGALERTGRPYAVVLCDIDRFKAFNDSRGHQAGDEVLRVVAGRLRQSARREDSVYRYGGEELLVLLPGQDRELAAAAAERMRAAVEALAIPHSPDGSGPVITVSIGVAVRDRTQGDPDQALGQADDALYRAKRAGRNRVVVHVVEPQTR